MTTYGLGYMAGRAAADRRERWRLVRRDSAFTALAIALLSVLICWALSPMPPVLP